MLSLNSPAFTALVILVLSLLRSPVAVECLHLTVPFWKMVVELVFYLVINKFPGYVVLATFVAALALLVYTYRFTRVIALCLQGVSPFDKARYAAIDAYASSMYRPDVSGASWVARDVAAFPPLHGASAPALSSSEACSSPSQSEGTSEVISSPFSSPSVNGPGPLDRANHEYRPIVVGSVLVTNPNLISLESDVLLAGLSFDELCQLEADERAYYLSRNMEIASDCDSPADVAALSVAPVDGGVTSGSAVVNDGCTDMFSGALFGGVATATVGAGVCFSSVVASADLISVDADNSVVVGTKRFREDIGDDLGVGETSRKRSKTRLTTAVCGFCCASVLRAVARADVCFLGSCAVVLGCKRPRPDDDGARQEGKKIKAAFGGNNCLVLCASGETSVGYVCTTASPFSAAATGVAISANLPAAAIAAIPAAAIAAVSASALPAATIHHPTAASFEVVASEPTTTAVSGRRIAVPRTSSRRQMAPNCSAIPPFAATATIAASIAITTSVATASPSNVKSKAECANNSKADNDNQSEGFDLSAGELDRLLNEIDQEFD